MLPSPPSRVHSMGAAEILQLLADEVLGGDGWPAVMVLVREEQKRLGDRLVHIDASIALMQRPGDPTWLAQTNGPRECISGARRGKSSGEVPLI